MVVEYRVWTPGQERFLKGSLFYHLPTSTHKLFFANKNQHLLRLVAILVEGLGFTQNTYINKVQVSRKA